jgi:hypothetical protein
MPPAFAGCERRPSQAGKKAERDAYRENPTMTATIRIEMDNAAFEGNLNPEVARILRELADRIHGWAGGRDLASGDRFSLHDFNGNKVGTLDVN